MSRSRYSLAIETSTRACELALGRDDGLIETVTLPSQRRHHVGLMPGIDNLCRNHAIGARDIEEVHVSLGPGSFTGLRVAVAAAKMLAIAADVKIVGVSTLWVVAHNGPAEHQHVAACLNLKRDTVYCAVYRREAEEMVPVLEPGLRTLTELLHQAPRPVALLGEMLPQLPRESCEGISVMPPEQARPRGETVWRLGRRLAAAGRFTDPMELEPMYVRRPEAVELWERRHPSVAVNRPG